MKIAVLVTCFNRVDKTIGGLAALFDAAGAVNDADFEVFLVDDASPDNTGTVVKETYPLVHVIQSTGDLYWNRGMCLAYAHAKSSGPFEAYLLFNDDVQLMPDAMEKMISAYIQLNRENRCVIVGPMCSRTTHETTYCGFDLGAKFRPLNFVTVLPNGSYRECDTFNTNCTLVPARAMDEVGGFDPAFHHHYGDLDLGLVLRKRGCRAVVLPGPIGYCETNPPVKIPSLGKRLAAMFTLPSPISDRIHFTYKRYPWPLATILAAAQVTWRFIKVFVPHQDAWEH